MDFEDHITGIPKAGMTKAPARSSPAGIKLVPVVLATEQGRALRPLTGPERPKPLLKGVSGRSLIQESLIRVRGFYDPLVICSHVFGQRILDEMVEIALRPGKIICTPAERGSAVALGLAAFMLERSGHMMLVMPGDHYIENAQVLQAQLQKAAQFIEKNKVDNSNIVAIGSVAQAPQTRLRYLKTQEKDGEMYTGGILVEKPSYERALQLSKTPGAFRYTGMFLIRPAGFLALLRQFSPAVYRAAQGAYQDRSEDDPFLFPDFDSYFQAPAMSVEQTVLAHCRNINVCPLKTEWNDMGCWSALLRVKIKGAFKNFGIEEPA